MKRPAAHLQSQVSPTRIVLDLNEMSCSREIYPLWRVAVAFFLAEVLGIIIYQCNKIYKDHAKAQESNLCDV